MAEIFLRLACGLVAWILVFAHGTLIAVIPAADCSPELWRVTMLFAGLGAVAAALLPAALAWRDTLRWIALLALPLWVYGAWVTLGLWETVGGAAPCDVLAATATPARGEPWQRAWAPLQLGVILACAAQGARYWLPRRDSAAAEHGAE